MSITGCCISQIMALGVALGLFAGTTQAQDMASDRQAMVDEVAAMARAFDGGAGKGAIDPRVLAVLGRVPRHEFVPLQSRASAYDNRPLSIGHGQTISQPYIVALMTDLLAPRPQDTILEVGTGSGYQAAVLAQLVRQVYSVEIIAALATAADERLARLGYANVSVRHADGYHGWSEHAPYDGIIVTAAAPQVPPPLVQQLKRGGRMVIPIGAAFQTQQLMLVEKRADGALTTRQLMAVRFVPLTGGHD